MAMVASPIQSIPNEVLLSIICHLPLADQSSLSRTCKQLHDFLTPTVWSDVELHWRGTHEGRLIEEEFEAEYESDDSDADEPEDRIDTPEFPYSSLVHSQPVTRKYVQPAGMSHSELAKKLPKAYDYDYSNLNKFYDKSPRTSDNGNRRSTQQGREEQLLAVKAFSTPARWAQLAGCLRSVCMSTAMDEEVIGALADMTNLRSLELVGLPMEPEKEFPREVPAIRFCHLENLRLRGYFPSALVREMVRNAVTTIRHLNLGLLATPQDDKANAILSPGKEEGDDEEGDEEDGDGEDDDEDDEDNGEGLPWALHSVPWLPKDLTTQFTFLTHLRLTKPYSNDDMIDMCSESFEPMPGLYERAILHDWTSLLKAASSTLKEIIFEHRMAQNAGDRADDGGPVTIPKGGFGWRLGPPPPDLADRLFCETVLKTLLQGGTQRFLHLKHLALRGIRIRLIPTGALPGEGYPEGVPGLSDGFLDNAERLRVAFPDCDVELSEEPYPIFVYGGQVCRNWPNNRHEAHQDEGDGLLNGDNWYNDYRRRYGPEWRVVD